MVRHRLRSLIAWSSIAAIALELLFPAVSAAATGGGDFPALRLLLTVL